MCENCIIILIITIHGQDVHIPSEPFHIESSAVSFN